MTFFLKLAIILVAVAAAIPLLAPNATVGRIVGATLSDAAGFCARQPDTCERTSDAAKSLAADIAKTLRSVADDLSDDTLTETDRNLGPAIATHGGAQTTLTKWPDSP